MPMRGPRGGRGRGRGTRRGRGRGGKVTTWERHDNYTPSPEVYDQLWRIRREPVTVTPRLPTQCPIRNAQTRILDRRQTEGDIQRNFYVVEVRHSKTCASSIPNVEDVGTRSTEIVHVDLSRILEYASPDQLECFENEQFRIETEAEAVAMRIEAEKLARRRSEKNARETGVGLDTDRRPRGRPRGRGRGRGRGSWRGRGALVTKSQLHHENTQGQMVDVEPDGALHRDEEDLQLMIAETESESEDLAAQTSPSIARSAFVTNSALSGSPILSHRRLPTIPVLHRRYSQASVADESSFDSTAPNSRSMSTIAMQPYTENDSYRLSSNTGEHESWHLDRHRGKRRRTESRGSNEPAKTNPPASAPEPRTCPQTSFIPSIPESLAVSDAPEESTPAQPSVTIRHSVQQPHSSRGIKLHKVGVQDPHVQPVVEQQSAEEKDDDKDADAKEYVVETIIEHYYDAGRIYYLVKWQDYEDSHDWLPEEDLEDAAELVAEYHKRVQSRKDKHKMMK